MPGKNSASTRFSGLDQVDTNNVANLRVELTFSTGVLRGHEAAPIVHDGTTVAVMAVDRDLIVLRVLFAGSAYGGTLVP